MLLTLKIRNGLWKSLKSPISQYIGSMAAALMMVLFTGGCSDSGPKIRIDGSSTVYPVTEAVVEEFVKQNKEIKITVGHSGTGGGLKKFCRNEIDVTNASRTIKKKEMESCSGNGIGFTELTVALDGIAIVVHPSNTWAASLTVKELKKIWEPEAQDKIKYWDQVRPGFPHVPLVLYGAGVSSGTYDYFTEAVVGKPQASRGDYNASEDDNVLVGGVAGEKGSLGFFGIAYYEENAAKLKLVPIDAEKGSGPVLPTVQNIMDGTYEPLSRPLYVYVNQKSASRPEIRQFIEFYLTKVSEFTREVGYIPMPAEAYVKELEKFRKLSAEKR